MCHHDWCGKCRVPWHEGLTCDEHMRHCGEQAADQGFAEYKKENKACPCPPPIPTWHPRSKSNQEFVHYKKENKAWPRPSLSPHGPSQPK